MLPCRVRALREEGGPERGAGADQRRASAWPQLSLHESGVWWGLGWVLGLGAGVGGLGVGVGAREAADRLGK